MRSTVKGNQGSCWLLLHAEHQVRPPYLAGLGADRPMVAQAVAQANRVQLLRETDAVAHVQARREVLAEDERGLVVEIGLHADVGQADAGAELLSEDGATLSQELVGRGRLLI